jgi:hypothetical protein
MTNKEMSPMSESPATPNVADLFHAYAHCIITALGGGGEQNGLAVGQTHTVYMATDEVVVLDDPTGCALLASLGDRWELAA